MEKYIEEIIEIILDNVSCEHQPCDEYNTGGIAGSVDYSLDNEQEVIKKAIEALPARLIEKPLLTEKFINEKVDLIYRRVITYNKNNVYPLKEVIKESVCSLLNELAAKINLKGD